MTRELFILKVLREAGAVCMKGFGHVKTIQEKQDQSDIVTEVDLASERKIVSHIKTRFPNDTIVAEETGYHGGTGTGTWVIDPIDGTSNFAAGVPWFGIMVAYMEKGIVTASGIYLPALDELYYAERGRGSYCNGKRIRVSSRRSLRESLIAYGIEYDADPNKVTNEARLMERLVSACRNVRATNSAVDDCYVARGIFGGSVFQYNMVWDVAAPSLIVEEAGGMYTDTHGRGLDFRITETSYLQTFTSVAAPPAIHKELITLIAH